MGRAGCDHPIHDLANMAVMVTAGVKWSKRRIRRRLRKRPLKVSLGRGTMRERLWSCLRQECGRNNARSAFLRMQLREGSVMPEQHRHHLRVENSGDMTVVHFTDKKIL